MLDVAEKAVVKGPSNHSIRSLEGKVSAEEWKQRVELAGGGDAPALKGEGVAADGVPRTFGHVPRAPAPGVRIRRVEPRP